MMNSSIDANFNIDSTSYFPSIWDPKFIFDFIPSFTYEEGHGSRLEVLKEEVRRLIASTTSMGDPRDLLKLIDTIQQLGVAHHFDKEIEAALHHLYSYIPTDLYHTSLHFRLLRNNGFSINSDTTFNKFVDKDGKFMDNLREDVRGLLSLYEAADLEIPGEVILEEAKKFSSNHLKLLTPKLESDLAKQVKESLEIPLHRRMVMGEARNFIDAYQKDHAKNSVLLELAKLDFNVLQSIYLEELKELAQWLEELNFNEKLPFTRDRVVECHIYIVEPMPEPQFSKCRKHVTKSSVLQAIIDYVYDVYGSIDELEKFTEAVIRWDIKVAEELPEYMKACLKAMYSCAENVSKDFGPDVLPYIKENWIGFCSSMLKGARWNKSGYMPKCDEHIKNAWLTIGVKLGLTLSYVGIADSMCECLPECLENWCTSDLIYPTCCMGRLLNDLATYEIEMKRGEVINSIQCYMKEHGLSEEEAKDHVKGLINNLWKKLNELVFRNSYPLRVVKLAMDYIRCLHCAYKYDDLFGHPTHYNANYVSKIFFESIPME